MRLIWRLNKGGQMGIWQPNLEESKYLYLVISMSTDCIMLKGTSSATAYTKNLRIIADHIDQISSNRMIKEGINGDRL